MCIFSHLISDISKPTKAITDIDTQSDVYLSAVIRQVISVLQSGAVSELFSSY